MLIHLLNDKGNSDSSNFSTSIAFIQAYSKETAHPRCMHACNYR